jgi:AraC family transcriptional regulator
MQTDIQSLKPVSVRIENISPFPVAYLRHLGPYAGDSALFGRLFGALGKWAGPRGLIRPDTKWLSVYHDDPDTVEPQNQRLSVALTIPSGTTGSDDVNMMNIDGGTYAVAHFEIDPDQFGPAWGWMMSDWLPTSGYRMDDRPCLEFYLNNPKEHPKNKNIVELWVPVKAL